MIPAAFALAGTAGVAGLLTRDDRWARLASLLLAAGGTLALLGWLGVAHTLRAHAAPAAAGLVVALALGVVGRARAAALAPGASVRRLPGCAVPLPGAHRKPGREPPRPALRRDRRGLARARARRARRPGTGAPPCSAARAPTRPAARLGERVAGLEHERDRGRQGDGVLRAALRRAAGGARGAPPAAPASRRPVARAGGARARVRRRGRLPGAPPRRLVEPQADGLERVQLVLPRQLDLLRPVDLRALPGGHDHARVRGAPVRHRAPPAAGRDRGGAGLDRDPHVVLPVGVVRALRGGRDGTRAGVRPPPRRGCCCWAHWPSASRSWPCPRYATPASTA